MIISWASHMVVAYLIDGCGEAYVLLSLWESHTELVRVYSVTDKTNIGVFILAGVEGPF